MTIAPSPANPELLQVVKDLDYEEVFNDSNPPEESTQLGGVKIIAPSGVASTCCTGSPSVIFRS